MTKNKKFLIGFLMVVFITGVTLFLNLNPKKEIGNTESVFKKITNNNKVVDQDIPTNVTGNTNKETSTKEVTALQSYLPIYIENINTTAEITTTINIFRTKLDPEYTVHLEIYGIDILTKDMAEDNPNIIAFRESFQRALAEIQNKGVDPKKLYFIFGTKTYIREINVYWIEKLGLL